MKARILTVAVAVALLFSLVGCSTTTPSPPLMLTLTDAAGAVLPEAMKIRIGESTSFSVTPSEPMVGADQPTNGTFVVHPSGTGNITIKASKAGYTSATYTISVVAQEDTPNNAPNDGLSAADDVFRLTNAVRMYKGLPALSHMSDLDAAAQIRASELAVPFSHTRPNGKPYYTALGVEEGKNYNYSENIAKGYAETTEILTGWINTPGRIPNILDEKYTGVGVGVEGKYWVQIFYCDNDVAALEAARTRCKRTLNGESGATGTPGSIVVPWSEEEEKTNHEYEQFLEEDGAA